MRLDFIHVFILFTVVFNALPQFYAAENTLGSLKLVQILIRYGEKNPDTTYPTDPYKDKINWPGGYSQITDGGKLRMYNIGQYFRNEYNDLIQEVYTPKDVYMLSSDNDYTIRSAMAFCAGLYKESSLNSTWNPDIKWDPVPVHTIAQEHDRIFQGTEPCPKLDEIFNYAFNDSSYARKLLGDIEMINSLSQSAGVNFTSDLHYLSLVYESLIIQKEFNLTLPAWTDNLLNSDQIGNMPYNIYIKTFNTRMDWLRLRVGSLLSNLVANMEEVRTEGAEIVLMHFWMTHDVALSAFIDTLDLYDQNNLPVHGSSIILELYERNSTQNSNLEYFVHVYIKNDTTRNPPEEIRLPGCSSPCSLEEFKTLTRKFIPEDWETECKEKMEGNAPLKQSRRNSKGNGASSLSGFISVMGFFLFVCVGSLSIMYIYKRTKQQSYIQM